MATEDAGTETEDSLTVTVDYEPGRFGRRLLNLDDELLTILLILILTFSTAAFMTILWLFAT